MPTVNLILWLHRGGQVAGAQLLRELLEQNGFTTRLVITSRELPLDAYRADCNLFSSEISPLWLPLARKNVLIPNQEQDVRQSFGRMHRTRFSETDEQLCYLRLLDKLLTKTRHAQGIYAKNGLNCAYVGFTCRDRLLSDVRREAQPWLCVIGDSYANKDVVPVLRVWRRNPHFPKLLVCLHDIPPGLEPMLAEMPNVTYRREKLADDELRILQNKCSVHICPSMMEGWGHALVESMSVGAMVLTLGAPPMDEHVDESRGVLFGHRGRRPHAFGFMYAMDEASLEQAVRRATALSDAQRRERGRQAREYFVENDKRFRAAFVAEMHKIVESASSRSTSLPPPVLRGRGGEGAGKTGEGTKWSGEATAQSSADAPSASDSVAGSAGPLPNPPPEYRGREKNADGRESERLLVEVSAGELLDKISILRIKRLRLKEPAALANVIRELGVLESARDGQLAGLPQVPSLAAELESVNAALWQTEDKLRLCEGKRDFGPEFIALARSVYRLNDRRAALKRQVNEAAGSRLVEEKLHPAYQKVRDAPKSTTKLLQDAFGHQRDGKADLAKQCCRQILTDDPNQPDALHLLSLLLHQQGRADEAMEFVRRALAARPGAADFHNTLGMLLGKADRHAEAEASFRTALELCPGLHVAAMNLGSSLMHQGKIDESIETHLKSVAAQPQLPEAHYNYAEALGKKGLIEQAASEYARAIELRPGFAAAFNNLGICRGQLAQPDLARAAFEKAIELQENFPAAHWNRGRVLLLSGEWEQGWKEYAWRWGLKEFADIVARFREPKWDGGDISGRTILLHAEQGLGDTLQFIRYVPLLAARGAKVIVEVQPELAELLRCVAGVERLVPRGEPLPAFEIQAPLLDLPLLFGTTLENVPAKTPYLYADPRLVSQWHERLSPLPGRLRVGLSWEGSAVPDPLRTCPASELAALAGVADVAWISLQKNPSQQPPAELGLNDLPGANESMEQTAAVIANLDLVISIDTAVAHLAGALGKPIWTLIPHAPDWRWLRRRDHCPWYLTMRLFRQPRREQWQPVLQAVANELRAARGNKIVL